MHYDKEDLQSWDELMGALAPKSPKSPVWLQEMIRATSLGGTAALTAEHKEKINQWMEESTPQTPPTRRTMGLQRTPPRATTRCPQRVVKEAAVPVDGNAAPPYAKAQQGIANTDPYQASPGQGMPTGLSSPGLGGKGSMEGGSASSLGPPPRMPSPVKPKNGLVVPRSSVKQMSKQLPVPAVGRTKTLADMVESKRMEARPTALHDRRRRGCGGQPERDGGRRPDNAGVAHGSSMSRMWFCCYGYFGPNSGMSDIRSSRLGEAERVRPCVRLGCLSTWDDVQCYVAFFLNSPSHSLVARDYDAKYSAHEIPLRGVEEHGATVSVLVSSHGLLETSVEEEFGQGNEQCGLAPDLETAVLFTGEFDIADSTPVISWGGTWRLCASPLAPSSSWLWNVPFIGVRIQFLLVEYKVDCGQGQWLRLDAASTAAPRCTEELRCCMTSRWSSTHDGGNVSPTDAFCYVGRLTAHCSFAFCGAL